jgi:hypothetical protein
MHSIIDYFKKTVVCILLSMFIAAMSAFIITRKIEVIAGASLFGLFILPSIMIYYTLDYFHKTQKAKIIGFTVPILVMLILFVIGLIAAMNGTYHEGENQMAMLALVSIFMGGVVVYLFMSKIKWLK